jgi:hypothetical protein
MHKSKFLLKWKKIGTNRHNYNTNLNSKNINYVSLHDML